MYEETKIATLLESLQRDAEEENSADAYIKERGLFQEEFRKQAER
jgi:hypothetical protein